VLSVFVGLLCSNASAGYGRAQRLYEFLEVLYPFLGTLSLFLASPGPGQDIADTLLGYLRVRNQNVLEDVGAGVQVIANALVRP
jgi:hypothetical protein